MKFKHERYDLKKDEMKDVFNYKISSSYMAFLFEFDNDKVKELWVANSGSNLGDYKKSKFFKNTHLSAKNVYDKIKSNKIKIYNSGYVERDNNKSMGSIMNENISKKFIKALKNGIEKDLKLNSILEEISKKVIFEQKEKYPELQKIVNKIVPQIVSMINTNIKNVNSKMPYKAQWVLEEIIKELQKRV